MKKLIILSLLILLGSCKKKILEHKIDKLANEINGYSLKLSKDEISVEDYQKIVLDSLVSIYDSMRAKYDSLYKK